MKRVLILMLAVVFTLSMVTGLIVGCKTTTVTETTAAATTVAETTAAATTAAAKQIVFAYASVRQSGSPWNTVHEDKIAELAKTENFKLYQYDCQMDVAKLIAQMEEAITLKPDVLGFLDIDDTALGAPAKKAFDAGIPVISSMGMLNEEFWPYLKCTTGASYLKQGEAAAELFVEGLNKVLNNDLSKAKILVLQGFMNQVAAQERDKGFKERLKVIAPTVEILDSQTAKWDKAQALTITETWLTKYPQVNGIFGANGGMALGAVEALDAAGKLKDTIVVGIDAVDDELASIKAGRQYGSVAQDPRQAAVLVIDLVKKIVAGEPVEFVNLLPNPKINADNVDQFIVK